ncbi:hypothetical protein HDV05_003398 [Chytridiales sp. JEL 0842]|nr:hypothetical protein HDV05_003398 [Chytridiales sp. JEL 0842]
MDTGAKPRTARQSFNASLSGTKAPSSTKKVLPPVKKASPRQSTSLPDLLQEKPGQLVKNHSISSATGSSAAAAAAAASRGTTAARKSLSLSKSNLLLREERNQQQYGMSDGSSSSSKSSIRRPGTNHVRSMEDLLRNSSARAMTPSSSSRFADYSAAAPTRELRGHSIGSAAMSHTLTEMHQVNSSLMSIHQVALAEPPSRPRSGAPRKLFGSHSGSEMSLGSGSGSLGGSRRDLLDNNELATHSNGGGKSRGTGLKKKKKQQPKEQQQQQQRKSPEIPAWNISTRVEDRPSIIRAESASAGRKSSATVHTSSYTPRASTPSDDNHPYHAYTKEHKQRYGADPPLHHSDSYFDNDTEDPSSPSNPDEPEDRDSRTPKKYPVTPHQLQTYLQVSPPDDETDGPPTPFVYKGPPTYTTQYYLLNGSVDVHELAKAVNRTCTLYKILGSRLWRNDKIVDADVEGFFEPRKVWTEIPLDQYVEELEPTAGGFVKLSAEGVTKVVREWMGSVKMMERLFTVLVVKESSVSHLIFVGSTAILDEVSCSFVAKQVFKLYSDCLLRKGAGYNDSSINAYLDSIEPKEEADDFIDFAYSVTSSRNATSYWKDVCIETVQESVEGSEKTDIESQLKKLTIEIESLRTQVASLTKRKTDLDTELADLKLQRMQIDVESSGPAETYMDPVTGEIIEISKAAKAAILKVVLGNEAVEDNVTGLLSKHEVPLDVQQRLGTATMTLEAFSSISEDQLTHLGIMTRDRRKLLALSEYVRNRMKESLQEQTKVKFALERKILKTQRELETVSTNLRTARNALDSNDDMALRLANILKPPSIEIKVHPLTLENHVASFPGEADTSDYSKLYGFVPFELSQEIVNNMRQFRDGCKQSQTLRKAQLRKEVLAASGNNNNNNNGNDSDFSSADESGLSDVEGRSNNNDKPHTPKQSKNTDSVCLAAFAVLLKHISGSDKFLIGLNTSHRKSGVLVGPLSSIVPLKIDMGSKTSTSTTTFNSLLMSITRSLRENRKYLSDCPFANVAQKFNLESKFSVQFEYISQRELESWRVAGLDTRDAISMQGTYTPLGGGVSEAEAEMYAQRMWSVNEQSTFDLKMIIVEDEGEVMVGGVQYRRDRFEEEKVVKWVAKFLTTLEGIEFGPRKLAISSMISRYYSSVFNSKGDIDSLGSISSMLSSPTLMSSKASLL